MSADQGWDRGWDEHRRWQLRRWAALSFAEKLAWLDDMQSFVDEVRKSRASLVSDGKSRP
jgi:hypothetical protein